MDALIENEIVYQQREALNEDLENVLDPETKAEIEAAAQAAAAAAMQAAAAAQARAVAAEQEATAAAAVEAEAVLENANTNGQIETETALAEAQAQVQATRNELAAAVGAAEQAQLAARQTQLALDAALEREQHALTVLRICPDGWIILNTYEPHRCEGDCHDDAGCTYLDAATAIPKCGIGTASLGDGGCTCGVFAMSTISSDGTVTRCEFSRELRDNSLLPEVDDDVGATTSSEALCTYCNTETPNRFSPEHCHLFHTWMINTYGESYDVGTACASGTTAPEGFVSASSVGVGTCQCLVPLLTTATVLASSSALRHYCSSGRTSYALDVMSDGLSAWIFDYYTTSLYASTIRVDALCPDASGEVSDESRRCDCFPEILSRVAPQIMGAHLLASYCHMTMDTYDNGGHTSTQTSVPMLTTQLFNADVTNAQQCRDPTTGDLCHCLIASTAEASVADVIQDGIEKGTNQSEVIEQVQETILAAAYEGVAPQEVQELVNVATNDLDQAYGTSAGTAFRDQTNEIIDHLEDINLNSGAPPISLEVRSPTASSTASPTASPMRSPMHSPTSLTATSPPPSPAPPPSDGFSPGAVIGIVLASVFALLIIVGTLLYCWWFGLFDRCCTDSYAVDNSVYEWRR
jgi:hypothetical protein